MANKVWIDGIWYELNEETKEAKVTHSGNDEEKYQGEVVIPEIVVCRGEKYVVTSIGSKAFEYCIGLTSIIIPESVTSIGVKAFEYCIGLISITIPESVTSIGPSAFTGTAWYDKCPDGVIYIGKVLYQYKGTMPENTSIKVKEGIICIDRRAFQFCSGLISITIPESVTSIGDYAFCDCKGLTSITIPESVTSIKFCAFRGCSGLTSITIPESVTSIGWGAFDGCIGLTSITIPENVTKIDSCAFKGCIGLTSIIVADKNPQYDSRNDCNAIIETKTNKLITGCAKTIIPENITSIGWGAFDGCVGLTSITISENVTKIESCAFRGCSGLTSIIVADKNPQYDSRNDCNAIIETNTNKLIAGCAKTNIPENVTNIGDYAFCDCKGLTSITIPKSVTKIGINAFFCCNSLTSIIVADKNPQYDSRNDCNAIIETKTNKLIAGCAKTIIPESVTSIKYAVFRDCNGLTSITIPKSVTCIEDQVFYNCIGLKSIIIPESVTEIGPSAFAKCNNLKDIFCYNFSTGWRKAFDNLLVGDITLHVPNYVLDKDGFFTSCNGCIKKNYCVLSKFKNIVPIQAKVKEIELPETIILSENVVHTLAPIIKPRYATEQGIKWSSSNEELAVVNSKGRVIALSSGTATITAMATDGSEVCASCEVVVRRMVKSIQLSQTSIKLVVGNSHMLNAIVTPKDAYDTSFTWSTTDDDIAMILGNGRIVAVSAGTATITAKANDGSGATQKCEVIVSK